MKKRYVAAGLLGVVGVVFVAWLAPRWSALSTFPRMPSRYEAKETCSCRFVEGRDAAFCDAFVFQDVVPSQGRTVDEAARRVTARALWVTSSARWVSERDGCLIE